MANHAPPAATPDGVVDHLPACKERCVYGCRASQPRAFETWSVHYSDAPRQAKAHGRLVPFGERDSELRDALTALGSRVLRA